MKKRSMMILACLFLFIGMATAQSEITGTVISQDDGQPVVGATVMVSGTSTGTVTDIDGNFTLTVPNDKSSIKVQYIGLVTQTVTAKNNMKIFMKSDSKSLDEVIVTGYGNFKKSSFTGSAATMTTDKLQNVPTTSIEDKLAGNVPGVSVSTSSGAPGAISHISIRGMGSINAGNDPLYVIDGTPMQSGNVNGFSDPGASTAYNDAGTNVLSTINSNDIESITVIKDAAAASLYGSRAANGVIVITTKSGQKGKTKVNFRSDWGFSNSAVNYRPMLSGDDRRTLLWTGLKNYGLYNQKMSDADASAYADAQIDNYAAKPSTGWTNWKDLLFKTGHHQNYEVSLSGGGENTQFYASMAYTKQDGIIANEGMERFTGNTSLTHTVGKFQFKFNSLFSKVNQRLFDEGVSYDGALANYGLFQNPSTSPYDENGNLVSGCGMVGENPLYEFQHSSDRSVVNRAYNTLMVTYNIWDNLKLSEKVAYDYTSSNEDVLWDKYSANGAPGGVMQRNISEYTQLNTQTQLSYIKSFGEHNIDALLGFETEDYKYSYNYIGGSGYPGELYEFANAGSTQAESKKFGSRLTSFLGRLNYNYANKYYLGLSLRTDGSSRLARDNRWGTFWSVSGSWRFTDEAFVKPITNILTDGKIRLSYGVNGTQPSGYYSYMNLYKFGQYYDGTSGIGIVGVGNENLKWEKNRAFNLGLDLTFLSRYSLTFDYYVRKTSDLIYDLPISAVPGYYDSSSNETTVPQNIGSLKNTGFELTLQSINIQKKDFNWTTSLNIGHNSNKVVKLNGTSDYVIDDLEIRQVGQPYYSYYMYEYAGVDPQTGSELYYINGDDPATARNTTTDVTKANKTIVGKHEASVEGGLTNNITWKFIDFGFTFTYSLGGDALDRTRWQHDNGGTNTYTGAVPAYYNLADMWTGPGDTNATLPKFQYGSTAVWSSRWLMPTDYLRLKNMTLGVSVPQMYLTQMGINKVRFYFSGSNLLTWKSKKLLVDPEMPVNGECIFQTPSLRTFTFGIEIGF